ncbi:hypothetical protein JCM6882_005422 [Rhodosporidiobolus microsporus]
MPFIEVPSRQLSVFYVLNPTQPMEFARALETEDAALKDHNVPSVPYDPSKPTLVLLHGGCRSIAALNAQLLDTRLRARVNILTFSRKYHGRTRFHGDPNQPYSIDDCAEDALQTVDLLCALIGIERYSVFAEGIAGCHVGTTLAIKRPERVVSLLLSSPGHMTMPDTAAHAGLRDLLPDICANKDGNGDGSGTIPPDVLCENSAYAFGDVKGLPGVRELHNEAFQRRYGTGHTSSLELRHLFMAEAQRRAIPADDLAKVTCPTLILHGTRDTMISPLSAATEWQHALVNVKGGADLKLVADGPHLLSFVEPNVVNRMILGFLSQTVCEDSLHDHIRRTSVVR